MSHVANAEGFGKFIYVCMHKHDLVLNNPQGLICRKAQPTEKDPSSI